MSEARDKEGSLTARTFWLMSAKTLAFAFAFALPVLLTRRLSQTEYGLFKQVFLVVTTAVAVLPLGFSMSAYYYLAREHDERRRGSIIFNILLFSGAVGGAACLALVARPDLLTIVFKEPALASYAPLVGLVILLWLFSSFLEVVAVANQEMRLATLFIVGAQLTKTLLMLAAALVYDSVEALIYAALAQGALQTLVLCLYLRTRFPGFWRGFDLATLRAQAAYAMPFGAAGLLYSLLMDLHNYFVSHRFDAATFAVYSVGVAQLPLVGILRESVGTVMIPRVSQLQKRGETREIVVLLARAMRKLAAVYLPLYALLMVVGREFLTVLFTEAYAASWPVFAVNLTLLPLSILEFDAVIRAYAEHKYFMLKLRVVLFALLVVALWFGVLRFGLVGAIAVVVAINLVERAATSLKFGRVIGIRAGDVLMLIDVGKLALASALAAVAAFVTRAMVVQGGVRPLFVLVVTGSVFAVVYLAAVWLLGVPDDDERASLRRRVVRLQRRTQEGVRAAHPLS
ncbi:MAG TPA: oligosaccharide flippase family protein [Pyrinomonadaceae bacterium]|nr:oligosaccharide flippase family protein [Pyrinomonadaceae bacterium]